MWHVSAIQKGTISIAFFKYGEYKLILLSMSCILCGWYMTFHIFCVLGYCFEHSSVNIYNNLDLYLHSFRIWCITFSYWLKLCIIFHTLIGPLEYHFLARSQNYEMRLLASSCLPVHLHWRTGLSLDGFSWNLIFEYFSKIYWEN